MIDPVNAATIHFPTSKLASTLRQTNLKNQLMRKMITTTFGSLDGIMQAPGGPEEDPTNGFTWVGWPLLKNELIEST